ncbi:MAG: cation transporter [Balneolaceae bacterium]|nr:cation transporter [Balneolaceae bacterium]
MDKTTFKIPKMDCSAEVNLVRMKLDEISDVRELDFDLPGRKLTVYHSGSLDTIKRSIQDLNLGGKLIRTEKTDNVGFVNSSDQRKILWIVLAINVGFFLIEFTFGLISNSMGLVADSLDMLADAFVYGISLLAVGGSLFRKKRVARIAGYFQLTLAILGFAEVIRRFMVVEELPDFSTMIVVSIFALIANVICLLLLQRSKSREAHMRASMIFTSNDVIINSGVILAGLSVNWLQSGYPDLIIGAIVFVIVMQGAFRILKLGK